MRTRTVMNSMIPMQIVLKILKTMKKKNKGKKKNQNPRKHIDQKTILKTKKSIPHNLKEQEFGDTRRNKRQNQKHINQIMTD